MGGQARMGAASGKDVPAASSSSGEMELNNLATISDGLSAKEKDIVNAACRHLTLNVYCQQEAYALAMCTEKSGMPEQQCKREMQALNACYQGAVENGQIQQTLIQIGHPHCRAAFDALAECKKRGGACVADERRFFVCSAAAFNELKRKFNEQNA